MTTLTRTIADHDFVNWVKAGLVLQFTKEGVEDLVSTVTNTFHQTIGTSLPGGITCTACKTENVLPCPTTGICGGQPNCRYHSTIRPTTCTSCEHFRNEVFNKHRFKNKNTPHKFGGPSWRNTNATQWSANPWELAKCYMAQGGYSHVTSAKETDLPGLLSVIITHTDFETNMAENLTLPENVFSKARQTRNDILHSPNHRVTDNDLKKYINTMVTLLSDPRQLLQDVKAQTAIFELTKIENGSMIITEEDIEKVKLEATKAIKEMGQQQVDDIICEGQLQIKAINTSVEDGKKAINTSVEDGKKAINTSVEDGKKAINTSVEDGKKAINTTVEDGKKAINTCVEDGKKAINTSVEDGKKAINTSVEDGKKAITEETKVKTEEGKRTLQEKTEASKDQIEAKTEEGKRTLQVKTDKSKDQIEAKTEESKRTIQEETVIAKQSIQQERHSGAAGNNLKTQYENKKSELKRKLIEIYKARHLTTELVPSNSEIDVKIAETYVKPNMKRVSVHKRGKTEATETRDEQENQEDTIRSYRDIIEKDPNGQDSQPCKNIYISGDAGSGKSSLCKHMVSTWCDVHSTTKQTSSSTNTETTLIPAKTKWQTEFIQQDNKTEMTKIDFVFYVSLRDCMSKEHVEEMIKSILPKKYRDDDIIAKVLDDEDEQCLIILDGLDEWTPPKQHEVNSFITKGLPNRDVWSKCSILTTTRPWKLAHLGLKSSEVDRQVNILGIDDASSSVLIDKVVDLLNIEYDRDKDAWHFNSLLREKNLRDMKSVPVMLKQLICLWHDGKSIGESQCEIYSGMFDLLFEKAESRLSNIDGFKEITETGSTIYLPKCFSKHNKCQKIIALLLSLANVAFFTIFSDNKSSTLVFEKSVAEYHGMSQAEMEICLKVGILSQTKHKDKCTEQNLKVSFLHKTLQEFLAALYIALPRETPEDPVDHIIQICDSVYKVLEMSKVFEFVAGMSPTKGSRISEHIGTVASADDDIQEYRQNILYKLNVNVESLIYDCFKEGELNGHAEMRLHLQDVTDTMAKYLKYIDNIKSASVKMSIYNTTDMIGLCSHKLQRLQYIGSTHHINSDFFKILQGSSSSLTVLFLKHWDMSRLTLEQFSSILYSLSCLLSIRFENITMTHVQYQCLVKFISQKTQLRKILLSENEIHDPSQEHSSEMNKSRKDNPNIKTDDDSMSTIGQEDIQKLSPQKQIQSLSNTDSDCNISTNVQSVQSPSGCNIKYKWKQYYVLDLSHHSQLDTLYIKDHYKTHTCTSQINSMHLEKCYLECDSALKSLKGALKLHSLDIIKSCTPQTIIQVLPTLTNLQSITISQIDFGREQLRLSPDMQHITKIELLWVTMTRTCFCGFIDSIPDTPHTVSVTLYYIYILPAEDQPQSTKFDTGEYMYRGVKFVKEYFKQSPRFVEITDDYGINGLVFKTKGLQ